MDSDKNMEEIELLEKALTDCRDFKKWIAGTLSKVEKLNDVANAKQEDKNIIQSQKRTKKQKKKNKKSKVKTDPNGYDSVCDVSRAATLQFESNLQNFNTLESKVLDLDVNYGRDISSLVSARNSHQCLSDYAKINKRYIEVKRSVESLMIDMKRVDDKLNNPKDDVLLSYSIEKPSGCGCHRH